MVTVEQVTQFVDENVLQSELYDTATETVRNKAVKNAERSLRRSLTVYRDKDTLPVEDVAEQAIWLLKMDDTMQRAELGATSISMSGVSISFNDKDRSVAPAVLSKYGLRTAKRPKVGSYVVPNRDTYRIGL